MFKQSLYSNTISKFVAEDPDKILGILNANDSSYESKFTQRRTWIDEVKLLQNDLIRFEGRIIFEYSIPRLGLRPDVILLINGIIFSLEFKDGATEIISDNERQALNYAISLRCYHEGSQNHVIVPILVATKAEISNGRNEWRKYDDDVYGVIFTNSSNLRECIEHVLSLENAQNNTDILLLQEFENGGYLPTPTIIEATTKMYGQHEVEDIKVNESKENLSITRNYVKEVIAKTKSRGEKAIIFVTGVPGAGKTLVGLDVASSVHEDNDHAVFLSGNGPLVKVLTEALALDKHKMLQGQINPNTNKKYTKDDVRIIVKPLIQNIHHYRDNVLNKTKFEGPHLVIDESKRDRKEGQGFGEIEHVAIFDEAQRSWAQKDFNDHFHDKHDKEHDMPFSESGFLIWSMDLREDWGVIVCLVGGGQEINHGEAGIVEWIKSIRDNFRHWNLYISQELQGPDYGGTELMEVINEIPSHRVNFTDKLHLKTSQRSIRSGHIASFVEAILEKNVDNAKAEFEQIKGRYPIFITRSIDNAKEWAWRQIYKNAEKDENGNIIEPKRCGILASSRAGRLKALGYEVKNANLVDESTWFLGDIQDPRSSSHMEIVSSEFLVQGLELDYSVVIWDADFRSIPGGWDQYNCRGCKWEHNNDEENIRHQYNAYRVLLTRSREGMVIVVPEGDIVHSGGFQDKSRLPEYYDCTYEYLRSLGIEELPKISSRN